MYTAVATPAAAMSAVSWTRLAHSRHITTAHTPMTANVTWDVFPTTPEPNFTCRNDSASRLINSIGSLLSDISRGH